MRTALLTAACLLALIGVAAYVLINAALTGQVL